MDTRTEGIRQRSVLHLGNGAEFSVQVPPCGAMGQRRDCAGGGRVDEGGWRAGEAREEDRWRSVLFQLHHHSAAHICSYQHLHQYSVLVSAGRWSLQLITFPNRVASS